VVGHAPLYGAELITATLAIGQPDPTKEATPALTSTAA
jgi:hypothetical protein